MAFLAGQSWRLLNSWYTAGDFSAVSLSFVYGAGKHKPEENARFWYPCVYNAYAYTKQLLDEVEHDIMNYQNRVLCYLPKPKAEADNTDTRF